MGATVLWIGVPLAAIATAIAAWGWFEAGWLRRRVLEVELAGLPPELDGLRIAHLSDFHLGVAGRGRRAVEDAVTWVAERQPDLVCVTGDLVSRRSGMPHLEQVLARLGTCYVVLGNHDLADSRDPFSQPVDARAIDALPGVTLLADAAVELELRGRRVQIVGVDPQSYAARSAEPGTLVSGDADLRILLCHFPGIVQRIPDVFQLVLSGHFHAGQIVVPYPAAVASGSHT